MRILCGHFAFQKWAESGQIGQFSWPHKTFTTFCGHRKAYLLWPHLILNFGNLVLHFNSSSQNISGRHTRFVLQKGNFSPVVRIRPELHELVFGVFYSRSPLTSPDKRHQISPFFRWVLCSESNPSGYLARSLLTFI